MVKFNKILIKNFLLRKKSLIPKENIQYDAEQHAYKVKNSKEEYIVDIENCLCSCNIGSTGQMCKHISSVVYTVSIDMPSNYWYNPEIKKTMYIIATNTASPENSTECETTNAIMTITQIPENNDAVSTECEEIDATRTRDQISQNDDPEYIIPDIADSIEEREKVKKDIMAWAKKLCKRIDEDNRFVPAAQKFLLNAQNNCSNDAKFLSALQMYGTSSCDKKLSASKETEKNTEVQPTTIEKEDLFTTFKRKLADGQIEKRQKLDVAINSHQSRTFLVIPPRASPDQQKSENEKNTKVQPTTIEKEDMFTTIKEKLADGQIEKSQKLDVAANNHQSRTFRLILPKPSPDQKKCETEKNTNVQPTTVEKEDLFTTVKRKLADGQIEKCQKLDVAVNNHQSRTFLLIPPRSQDQQKCETEKNTKVQPTTIEKEESKKSRKKDRKVERKFTTAKRKLLEGQIEKTQKSDIAVNNHQWRTFLLIPPRSSCDQQKCEEKNSSAKTFTFILPPIQKIS